MADYKLSYSAEEIDRRLGLAGSSILFAEQTLTEEQKAQARANIGIVLEEENVSVKEVTYTYDGNLDDDTKVYATASQGPKVFVKVSELPDGELNLIGSHVDVGSLEDWKAYSFDITADMLEKVFSDEWTTYPAVSDGLVQIINLSTGKATEHTLLAICKQAGSYYVIEESWIDYVNFPQTGIYFADFKGIGGQHYVRSFSTTYGTEQQEELNPAHYNGNEIQMFTRGLCVGDSITEGVVNYNGGQTTIKKYSYPRVLERITGIKMVNAGVSGLTAKTWYEASLNSGSQWGRWVNSEWVWSENPTVGESDVVSTELDYSGYDFAVIHLGINDIFLKGDTSINDTVSTFETNINNIINKLKTANTGIKVFLCTIIPSYAAQDFEAINEKIREIANAIEDVFLIDLKAYSECLENTPYSYLHLTALGYHKMATEIKSLICYAIKENLEKFKEVQFIGTDYSIGTN